MFWVGGVVAAVTLLATRMTSAQPADPPPEPDPEAEPPADTPPLAEPQTEPQTAPEPEPDPEPDLETVAPPPPWETRLKWTGYLDVGLFDAMGDGAGHVQDVGHLIFPQHDQIGWVFHGDPLATAINSRGEPADTGGAAGMSRAITFDSVDSRGNPTFLVNEINLDLLAALHPDVWTLTSVDLVPRGRNVSAEGVNLGDFVDVDLAFANWTVHDGGRHVVDLQAGKFDSVMGVEYRIQESPDRFGVTPSLIFRYLGGHPTGIKLRARMWDDAANVAVAVTNGSHFTELFPFADEQDRNAFKTGAARVALRAETDDATIEVGGSGLFGAQDQQPSTGDAWQWQLGGDVVATWHDLELRAEYTRGRARGTTEISPCDRAPCLRFQGAYGELSYRALNWLGLLGRVDWRDADHRDGDEFIYIVDALRATVGVRLELDRFVVFKSEYVHAIELAGRPSIANDVATSSLVLFF